MAAAGRVHMGLPPAPLVLDLASTGHVTVTTALAPVSRRCAEQPPAQPLGPDRGWTAAAGRTSCNVSGRGRVGRHDAAGHISKHHPSEPATRSVWIACFGTSHAAQIRSLYLSQFVHVSQNGVRSNGPKSQQPRCHPVHSRLVRRANPSPIQVAAGHSFTRGAIASQEQHPADPSRTGIACLPVIIRLPASPGAAHIGRLKEKPGSMHYNKWYL